MEKFFKRESRYLSPVVRKITRVSIAIMGGICLLVPMIVLAWVERYEFRILATVLFVLSFAILLALISKASSQELLGATAAYAAVLVVFVAGGAPTQ
jgi:hypothetical protein